MSSVTLPRLTLAVLTYRRNDLLAAVLPKLAAQVAEARAAGHEAELLVIDNAPDAGARAVVEGSGTDIPTRYVSEPAPGLAAARNRALTEAGDSRLLCFIDDDESPGPQWLMHLVDTWRESGAQAVVGPVLSLTENPLDDWTAGTRLFDRIHAVTGSRRTGMASNNLLLDLDFVRSRGLRFDERFGLTGGEDSRFGHELRTAGGVVVWCDEAEVSEVVPPNRLERSWITARQTRFGESWVRARAIDLTGIEALRFRGAACARGAVRVLAGQARLLAATARGREREQGAASAERAGGLGLIRGALGINREEYRRH